MNKHALLAWPVLLALACNNVPAEQKPADTTATIAATAVTPVPPVTTGASNALADTFTMGERTYYVVPMEQSPFPAEPEQDVTEMDVAEKAALARTTGVKRIGDTLLLPVDNGEPVAMVNNNSDGDDYAHYYYDSYLPEINCYCLIGTYYEASDYVLLNRSTGANIHVWGKPVISPDKKMLICPSYDLEAGFIPNGFQVFTNDNGALENTGDVSLTKWGPGRVKWLDNNTIAVEQLYPALDGNGDATKAEVSAGKITLR